MIYENVYSSGTQCSAPIILLPVLCLFEDIQIYANNVFFKFFTAHVLDFLPVLCCRKRLNPHHHHHHHYHHPIPPPSYGPWGFKHPNQLKERGVHCGPPPTSVREGKQEGPHSWAVQGNNITPSVTNCFISDGTKYRSQIRLLLYHLCILAYSTRASTNSQKLFVSDCLPPTSQHSPTTLQMMLLSQAACKKKWFWFTQWTSSWKRKNTQERNLHVKSSRLNVQSSEPESLMKEKAHIVFGGNTGKNVRCNLLITVSSFILKCCCCVWSMGVATRFFLPPELSRLCDVHNPICSIKLYYQTGHCSVLWTKWQPLRYLSKSTVLHADLKHNKIAQWSGKL